MIKFTDLIKANGRYWYILLVSIIVCFAVCFGVTFNKTSFTATSTMLFEKNSNVASNEFVSTSYAQTLIREMKMLIGHIDFSKKVIDEVEKVDEDLAGNLTVNYVNNNLKVSFDKEENFFEISFTTSHEKTAKLIVDIASKLAIDEFNLNHPTDTSKAMLTKVYSTQVKVNGSQTAVYSIVGVLIGLVIGEIIIALLILVNPYVENKDLMQSVTGVEVLSTLEKVRGDK